MSAASSCFLRSSSWSCCRDQSTFDRVIDEHAAPGRIELDLQRLEPLFGGGGLVGVAFLQADRLVDRRLRLHPFLGQRLDPAIGGCRFRRDRAASGERRPGLGDARRDLLQARLPVGIGLPGEPVPGRIDVGGLGRQRVELEGQCRGRPLEIANPPLIGP